MSDVLGRIAEDRDPSSLVRSFLNFEDALALVQRQFDSSRNDEMKRKLDRMQGAVLDTFRAINQAALLTADGWSFRRTHVIRYRPTSRA